MFWEQFPDLDVEVRRLAERLDERLELEPGLSERIAKFKRAHSARRRNFPNGLSGLWLLRFDQTTTLDSVALRACESGLPDTAKPNARAQNIRTAIAGELFVAGELSKRGWIATLTSKNTPGVDILANQDDRFLRIDVKTRTSGHRSGWQVGGVHISDPGDFIVLVDLGHENEPPEYWIVPARAAQNLVVRSGGRVVIRARSVEQFYDAWDLLDS